MPSLLIRDIDEETKLSLAVRAAQNGHSQQAEAACILKEALKDEHTESWISMLMQGAQSVGGIEWDAPKRHVPRITGIEL